jgi:hypothetical protein
VPETDPSTETPSVTDTVPAPTAPTAQYVTLVRECGESLIFPDQQIELFPNRAYRVVPADAAKIDPATEIRADNARTLRIGKAVAFCDAEGKLL